MKELFTEVVQSYECLNACLVNYLKLWGYEIPAERVYFDGNGFQFLLVEKKNRLVMMSSMYESSFHYLNDNNIEYIHEHLHGFDDAKAWVISAVRDGKFLALKTKSDKLLYNRVFKQTVSLHYIDVIDYDSEKNEVFVIDGDVPTMVPSTFKGWVDLDSIISGWEGSNYEYVEFFRPEHAISIVEENSQRIKDDIDSYLDPTLSKEGYQAVLALFGQLDRYKNNELADIARTINYQLRVEGLFSSRRYLLEYLKKKNSCSELANDLSEIIQKWNSICMMLIKVSISQKLDEVNDIIKRVRELVYIENNILEQCLQQFSEN